MEGAGQFQQVIGEQIRPEVVQDGWHDLTKAHQQTSQVNFLVVAEDHLAGGCVEGCIEFAENRADPHI